jgi:hypothetical protein
MKKSCVPYNTALNIAHVVGNGAFSPPVFDPRTEIHETACR